jgi:TRAP transporter TAXI family solute receptor
MKAIMLAAGLMLAPGLALAQQQIEILTLPTGSVASGAGTAIASIVSQKTQLRMLPVAYAGPQVMVPFVDSGKSAFVLLNVQDSRQAYEGEKPNYQQKHRNLRLVSVGYENIIGPMATQKSGIKTGAEMKGRSVAATFTAHQTCRDLSNAVLANLRMTASDINAVPVASVVPGVQALGNGRADASPCVAVGMSAVKEVNINSPLRFISIDPAPDAVKRAREAFPGLRAVKLAPGSYDGVAEETWAFGYDFYLVSNASASDDMVYQVVKTIWESLPDLQKINPVFSLWHQKRMSDADVTLPYHPGAIKFFKEKGMWTEEAQKATDALLK